MIKANENSSVALTANKNTTTKISVLYLPQNIYHDLYIYMVSKLNTVLILVILMQGILL